eukprot:4793879-Pleurochrysis_carterae.AAC.1
MTTILVHEPRTIKVVEETSRCSHRPVYEMRQPTTHEATTAEVAPLTSRSAVVSAPTSCGATAATRHDVATAPMPLFRIISAGLLTSTSLTASRCRCSIRSATADARLSARYAAPMDEKRMSCAS